MGFLKQLFSATQQLTSNILQDGESHWWGGVSSWSAGTVNAGELVTEQNILTSSTCFACTKALAETTAGLPGAVYKGLLKKKEIARSEQAWELLVDHPNSEMDSFTFMEIAVARVINSGNFFAEIQRDNRDRPIGLWPIHPSRVQPMRDSDGTLFWQITSDYTGSPEYQDATWRKNHTRFLSNHNMLNIVGFGSANGIMSPGILPGAQEIGIDFATRRYGGDFFRNGATPAGFAQHPGFYPDEARRNQFRADLNRIHSNKTNAHQIGVLWDGATYQQIGIAPEQAQFLETRRYTSHQICKMYGVPPAIIGDYADSKFATADAMIRAFVMISLKNLVERIERAINRQVMRVKGDKGRMTSAFNSPLIYRLAIDGLLRGDPKMQAETWKIMREGGIASANEWREDLDMNPIDGPEGDYRVVPGGYVRLENIDNQGDRQKNEDNQDKKPTFDREAMVELLEEALHKEQPVAAVRGSDVSANILTDTVTELACDALNRIHAIATTQISRWREQDPTAVAAKLPAFWEKQQARLTDALLPVAKVAEKINPESNVCQIITEAYAEQFAALDNYQIFDASRTALDLDAYRALIEEQL